MQDQYRSAHPGWRIVETVAPVGPWCKAAAINAAASVSTADIVVVADADVWATNLHAAVDAAQAGGWVIPHRRVHRLTEQATTQLIAGGIATETCEPPYVGIEGGGIVVLPRRLLLEVPMDERFLGWGQEDQAWGIALHFMVAPSTRLDGDLLHLWHPPQPRDNRKVGSLQSFALHRRYLKARNDPAMLQELLEGARHVTSSPAEPVVHHPATNG